MVYPPFPFSLQNKSLSVYMEYRARKITYGRNAGPDVPAKEKDTDKVAAAPSRRVPPPIPPRKRDSQLSLIVRKDSEPRLVQQQQNSKDDLPSLPPQGSEADSKDGGGGEREKGRGVNSEQEGSSLEEKRRPPEETPESPASSPGSGKPQVAARGKDVSNGGSRDDVKGEGEVQRPHEGGTHVRVPEVANGSAPSSSTSFLGTSEEGKKAPSSECSGAKPDTGDLNRDRERQADQGQQRPDPKSESESERRPRDTGGQAEEIEKDSESDSEERTPLLKERGEGSAIPSPGFGEGAKGDPFGSKGDSLRKPLLSTSEEKETALDRCEDKSESPKSKLDDVKRQEIPSVEQNKSSEAVGSNKTSEVDAEEESLDPESAKKRSEDKEEEEERTFISENSEDKTTPLRPEQAATPSPPTPLGMELSIWLSRYIMV